MQKILTKLCLLIFDQLLLSLLILVIILISLSIDNS